MTIAGMPKSTAARAAVVISLVLAFAALASPAAALQQTPTASPSPSPTTSPSPAATPTLTPMLNIDCPGPGDVVATGGPCTTTIGLPRTGGSPGANDSGLVPGALLFVGGGLLAGAAITTRRLLKR